MCVCVRVCMYTCYETKGTDHALTWGNGEETVPACSSGHFTIVLQHWNAMPKTQDMTPNLVTINIHRADKVVCLSIDVELHIGIHNFPF